MGSQLPAGCSNGRKLMYVGFDDGVLRGTRVDRGRAPGALAWRLSLVHSSDRSSRSIAIGSMSVGSTWAMKCNREEKTNRPTLDLRPC